MKKVMLIKRVNFIPNGTKSKVFGRPKQVVTVSTENAEKMINGNVAIEYVEPIEAKEPKKAISTKKKK